jgi:hypothetical protein
MTEQNQHPLPTIPISCVRIASHDRVSSLLSELFALSTLSTLTLADTPSKPHEMSTDVQRKLAARAVGVALVARRLARELEPCG